MSTAAAERQGTARYLQALGQHWLFIAGSALIALLAALAFLGASERRYEAHADLLVTPVPADDPTFVGLPVLREVGEGRGVLTAARLVETPQVADAVRAQLGVGNRDALLDAVSVAPQEQSNIVTIRATAPSPQQAADIANAFAAAVRAERTRVFQAELRQVVARLTGRLADVPPAARDVGEARSLGERLGTLRGLQGSNDPTLQITSAAVPPSEASWPRPVLSLTVALLLGLVLGIGVAIALELLNPLVLRDEDVLDDGLPLLTRSPRVSAATLTAQLKSGASPATLADAFRLARVNVAALGPAPTSILLTSAGRGDGTTSVSLNLALAYVRSGARVAIVDADLRRARLSRLALPSAGTSPGLGGVLRGDADLDDALMPVRDYGDRLRVLPAVAGDDGAIDLLQSAATENLLEELELRADVIIVDSPPITQFADALPLARSVDAVVLVVRYGRTHRDALARAQLLLRQLGVAPRGVVAVTRRRLRESASPRTSLPAAPAQRMPSRKRARSAARSS